jgi:hypothetical protein
MVTLAAEGLNTNLTMQFPLVTVCKIKNTVCGKSLFPHSEDNREIPILRLSTKKKLANRSSRSHRKKHFQFFANVPIFRITFSIFFPHKNLFRSSRSQVMLLPTNRISFLLYRFVDFLLPKNSKGIYDLITNSVRWSTLWSLSVILQY